jgi:hypothetical protein
MASNNYIYKMSNAGGLSNITRYVDMLAGNTTWNPWEPAGAYDALASVTVPSGGAASVTFAGIPTGYKHLQIRGIIRSTNAGTDGNARLRFNSDTGTNYRFHFLGGSGSGSGYAGDSGAVSFGYAGLSSAASSTSGVMGVQVIDVLDYANTAKNKTVRVLTGVENNGSGFIELDSSLWINTSAITSVSIFFTSGSIAQNSTFALYGVK